MKIFQTLKSYLIKLKRKKAFQNTLWLLASRIIGLFMQLAYFVLIARTLNADDYGLFIGIAAMASLVMSFASLGSGDLLIKYVSRDRKLFREYWGNTLLISAIASLILIAVGLFAAQVFFHAKVSSEVVGLILLSDLLCITLWNVAGHAFAAVDLIDQVAYTDLFYGVSKLVAAGVFAFVVKEQGLASWAWLYCCSSIATAIVSVAMVNHQLGYPAIARWPRLRELKEGLYFSVGQSADRINGDIDKTMLASSATLKAAGVYGAGDRFLTAAYTPMHVLFSATYMRFFKYGSSGISGALQLSKRLFPVVLIYGVLTTFGFLFFSPLIIVILGESYAEAVDVLKLLSPYILVLGLQNLAADTLTGAGFQSIRSVVHMATALVNLLLNFWLIPLYSWRGAAWATLISDGGKLAVLWLIVLALLLRDKRRSPREYWVQSS